MKKILIVILAIALVLGGFFVYKKKNKIIDTRKTITFWSIQLKPIYEVQMNNIIKQFENKHPDYKIQWIDIPINEAQKRTLASILSSTPPDLINLNPDFSVLLAQKNTLEFLDDKDLSQFSPSLIENLKYDNKVYALPFYATSAVTIYNKKNYDECFNKKFIKTYDEMFDISSKFAQCSKIATFAASLNENATTAKILNKYDISDYSTEEEKNLTSEIFSNLNKMYKNDELPKDTMALSHREVIEKYMAQKVNIIVAGANFIYMIKKSAPEVYENSEITNQLTGKNGKYDISLMNLIIPKRAKYKDLAFEFAQTLTNKENQLEFAKLTNVLPANKYALSDPYFTTCENDLYDKSRCISANQLKKLNNTTFNEKYKKEINEVINKTLEEILLNPNTKEDDIVQKVDSLSEKIRLYN